MQKVVLIMSMQRGRSWAVMAAVRAVLAVVESTAAFALSGCTAVYSMRSPTTFGTGLDA